MKQILSSGRIWLACTRTAPLLVLLLASCAEPVHVAWNEQQSEIEPQVPRPQGVLEVYSESYVAYDGDVPRTNRRPVDVYSVDGQLVVSEHNPFGDGPIRFDLTPGHYIIASESHMQGRRVQADVKDGRTTIVAESAFEHAPSLAASQPATTIRMTSHQPATSR